MMFKLFKKTNIIVACHYVQRSVEYFDYYN